MLPGTVTFARKVVGQCTPSPRVGFSHLERLQSVWRQQRPVDTVRCSGSTVKNMDKVAPKQLEGAEDRAKQGEDDLQDQRKGPTADRLVEIGAAFRVQCEERMGKAVSISKAAFVQQRVKGTCTGTLYGRSHMAELVFMLLW